MKAIRVGFMALVVMALLVIGACKGFFVSESSIQTVTVTPAGVILRENDTYNMAATATTVGGSQSTVTTTAAWTSSATGVATVGAGTGVVTAGTTITPGTADTSTISATYSGVTGTALILVTNTTTLPTTLTINYTNSALTLSPQTTAQLSAIADISGNTNRNVSSLVTWTISSTTYATVSSSGLVTPVAQCGLALQPACPTITGTVYTTTGTISGTFTPTSIE